MPLFLIFGFHVITIRVVPKKEPYAYRLIHHLSYAAGSSLNDSIDKDLASVFYAIYMERYFGPGAFTAEAEVQSAFRLLLIHLPGFSSLAFKFQGKYYVGKWDILFSLYYIESFFIVF